MKLGDEHIIACIHADAGEMRIIIAPVGDLCIEMRNKEPEGEHLTRQYFNHDTARALFGLLGAYLHTFPEA